MEIGKARTGKKIVWTYFISCSRTNTCIWTFPGTTQDYLRSSPPSSNNIKLAFKVDHLPGNLLLTPCSNCHFCCDEQSKFLGRPFKSLIVPKGVVIIEPWSSTRLLESKPFGDRAGHERGQWTSLRKRFQRPHRRG